MKAPSMTSTLLLAAAVAACCWFLPGADAASRTFDRSSVLVEDPTFEPLLFDDGDVIPSGVEDHAGLQKIWTWKRSSTDCAALLAQVLNQENKIESFTIGPRSVLPLEKSAELKKQLEFVEKLVAAGCPALVVF